MKTERSKIMTVVEKLRREIEAEGFNYRVIDLNPPMDEIEASLTEADREYIDFLRYSKAHSPAEAAIIPAPDAR
jgi:hypothetical protein